MYTLRRSALAALVAGSLFAGGAVGSTILGSGAAATKSSTSTSSSSSTAAPQGAPQGAPGAPNGKFVPNESKSHEAGESAAREAQEDAGQFPTVP